MIELQILNPVCRPGFGEALYKARTPRQETVGIKRFMYHCSCLANAAVAPERRRLSTESGPGW